MDRDRIEREIVVRADLDETWSALTRPERVSRWFTDHTEIDLRPGGAALFRTREGEHFHGVVETVEAGRRFAYRWCLEENVPVGEGPTTLVEFTLEEAEGGTRIRLVESGFASLAEPDKHLRQNTQGWRECLEALEGLLGEAA